MTIEQAPFELKGIDRLHNQYSNVYEPFNLGQISVLYSGFRN